MTHGSGSGGGGRGGVLIPGRGLGFERTVDLRKESGRDNNK